MASLNGSILLIALPAIFRGIKINPLAPGETTYLLWSLLGYMVVTAVLLVTCGRLSDMFGRVKLYNLGFAIFTLGSILLFFIQGQGNTAALELIVFRLIQGVGSAFLFANSTAILTDAFPANERGTAMGINQVAAIGGGFIGLIVGGILSAIDWRLVFLVSVPVGIVGTVWAYLMLHETAQVREHQKLDLWGNVMFAGGLTVLLVALTYSIQPYGNSPMGWHNPYVIGGVILGLLMLAAFVWIERYVEDPMFRLQLFRNRMFTVGNISGFLASCARGGLQFMLIIWLQGIWLPLHGYDFEVTPLWAGIYMLPLSAGFLIMGPLSGYLSDKYGSRTFATGGMLITAVCFIGLLLLPANFNYILFAVLILFIGIGMGMFSAPNTTAIMNALPAQFRGVGSGMRSTFQNTANTFSITLIFTLVTVGLAASLPHSLYTGLTQAGIPQQVATGISHIPPIGALFAAFLGYNPMSTLLPPDVLHSLPAAAQAHVLGKQFFPNLLADPFMNGVTVAFIITAIISFIAAIASLLRGGRYIYQESGQKGPADVPAIGINTAEVTGVARPPAEEEQEQQRDQSSESSDRTFKPSRKPGGAYGGSGRGPRK